MEWVELKGTPVDPSFRPPCCSRVSPEHFAQNCIQIVPEHLLWGRPHSLWAVCSSAQSLTEVRSSSSMGRTNLSYFHDVDAWTWLSPIIPWCWIFITFGLHTRWLFVANSFSLSESSTWNKFTIPPSKTKLCLRFESLQVLSQFHINNTTVPGSCPCNFKL